MLNGNFYNLSYCYEDGNGVLKMINKRFSKKNNECTCLHDQRISKYIATTSVKKNGDKEINKQQQHQYKK